MTTSPSVDNYWIGKGTVEIKAEGEDDFRFVGNVPEFEWTPTIEKLDHFSSMEGVKTKDKTIVLSKAGTLRMVLEEGTKENLALALLGTISQNTAGANVIEIFGQNAISCAVRFTGTNEVGQQYLWNLNKVDFIPGSSINLISDEWGRYELNGEAATVGGSFGTVEELTA